MVQTETSGISDPVREYLRRALLHNRRIDERRTNKIVAAEMAGHRVVDGGQFEGSRWRINDWRTGDLLAEGDDGIEGIHAACMRLGPGNTWLHIDYIGYDDEDLDYVETRDLPRDLAEVLQEWLDSTGISNHELAAVVGWPVEKVSECR